LPNVRGGDAGQGDCVCFAADAVGDEETGFHGFGWLVPSVPTTALQRWPGRVSLNFLQLLQFFRREEGA
jgi:hypothetical protein